MNNLLRGGQNIFFSHPCLGMVGGKVYRTTRLTNTRCELLFESGLSSPVLLKVRYGPVQNGIEIV